MTLLASNLAATGRGPRLLFGLGAAAALAASAWPVTIPAAPAPRPTAVAALPSGDAALRRPLFDPGRREWTARGDRAAVLEGDPPWPVLIVRGIRRDGGAIRALIDDGSGDRTWLGTGEGRGQWRIAEIGSDRVRLIQDGVIYTTEFMGPPAILRPPRRHRAEAAPQLRH